MKKILFSGIALLAALLCGCSENEEPKPPIAIDIQGEAIDYPMEVKFTVSMQNAKSAKAIIFYSSKISQEQALEALENVTDTPVAEQDFYAFPLDASQEVTEISANDYLRIDFSLRYGDYSVILLATDLNNEQHTATCTQTIEANRDLPYLNIGVIYDDYILPDVDYQLRSEPKNELIRDEEYFWFGSTPDEDITYYTETSAGHSGNDYQTFFLGYNRCDMTCSFLADDIDKEYTAEEVFDIAHNHRGARPMCLCGISESVSIKRTDKPRRFWAAVSRDGYYIARSRVVAPTKQ